MIDRIIFTSSFERMSLDAEQQKCIIENPNLISILNSNPVTSTQTILTIKNETIDSNNNSNSLFNNNNNENINIQHGTTKRRIQNQIKNLTSPNNNNKANSPQQLNNNITSE